MYFFLCQFTNYRMLYTRKLKLISTVTTRKVGDLTCLSKDLPLNLWCHYYSNSKTINSKTEI